MRKLRLYVNILGKIFARFEDQIFKGIIYLRHEYIFIQAFILL